MKQKYFPRKMSFHFLPLHLDVTLIASRSMAAEPCARVFRSFSFLLLHVCATGGIAVRGISIMLACSESNRREKIIKEIFLLLLALVVVFIISTIMV